jgi:dCTP deaminase
VLDGKSSLGRLGVSVHATAGFGDPGFDGQWTLEVTCVLPVRLYAGMRVAQVRFHAVQGEVQQYAGNYVEHATGPVASRSWRQFK